MRRAILAAIFACLSWPACAATYRVDDGASIPSDSGVTMRWRQAAPGMSREDLAAIEGTAMIQVRLNLAPWQGRLGRIYLVLPEQPVPLNVSWTTQGRLLPGQMVPGQRVAVYSGPISMQALEETLLMRFVADGTRMAAGLRLNFHFEIDVE